jgi:hypothetical protein
MNIAPPILLSSVASSFCPGALLLDDALVWVRFVVITCVHQYVLVAGDDVLGVMAQRLLEEAMEGATLACSARARASLLAASAACAVARLAVPWLPAVPEVSKILLSVSAALKCVWKVAHVFCFVVLDHHSRVETSNRPVAAVML